MRKTLAIQIPPAFVSKGDKYISGNETTLVWTTAAGGVSLRSEKSSLNPPTNKYKP
ncbi:hypothetical protein DEO72_LG5g6 [Vigna unguiculata]|uniref:Uncharacterized protein n=1 Tax=Vigna unguiculata TaxID=3917 RepID=A0A4D6LU02_VIGUN|nr:hypothetical protein DEO72_LG5g6 [Vigna unguiculata]